MLYVPPVPWTRILLEGRTVFPLSCLKTVRDLKALKCVVGCSTVVDGNPWLGCGLTELLDTTVDVCLWLGGYFHHLCTVPRYSGVRTILLGGGFLP